MSNANSIKSARIKIGILLILSIIFVASLILFIPTLRVSADSYEEPKKCSVVTNIYDLADNTGYKIKDKNPSTTHPLGQQWANIFINVNTPSGKVESKGTRTVNGKQINQYGIKVGEESGETSNVVDICLQYNFNDTTPINNGWEISSDTALSVDEYEKIGEIKSGALIISKSYDGKNWTWQREGYSNEIKNNFHTTDFTSYFEPFRYCEDDELTIYTPAGKDISRGVYIKVLFAYEIKKSYPAQIDDGWDWLLGERYETKWRYKNIVEESIFYLASNSAVVAFNNASDDNPETDHGASELVQQAGTIKDGEGTFKGFRLNKLENSSFKVKYRIQKPGQAPSTYQTAEDGQFFGETGRYDFIVTTSLGESKEYSIFVNNTDVNGAVKLYFGDPNYDSGRYFITDDSKRVFTIEDEIPVYVAGQTFYKINAVDQAYMPVAGVIRNLDTDNAIATIEGDYTQKTGTILEPGTYEAEFYSNKNYDSGASGDYYHFVFKFKVVSQEEVPGPVVNQMMLNNIMGVSDLQSSYYGVSVKTSGTGNAIYAFADYSSAYGFAYEYERGKVVATSNGFKYEDKDYRSQFDVLDKVSDNAKLLVERRYFDLSDATTYTTLDTYVSDVSSLNFSFDIVIFNSDTNKNAMKYGEPLLNDRVYRIVSLDGMITEGKYPFKFIQVAEFESSGVVLLHEETGTKYEIEYGVSVEQQLQAVNAPSGRYKITETTDDGDSVDYYAHYIKYSNIKPSIDVDIYYNDMISNNTYDISHNNLRTTVNAFILQHASNEVDPQSIVKVTKDGEQIAICTVEEIVGQAFYQQGQYIISLIDRLGNSFSLTFSIYIPVTTSTITFDDNGELTTQTVFEGQSIQLPTPDNKSGYIFVGWELNGTRYNDTYYVERKDDIVLTAVWHHTSVHITIYDGEVCATYDKHVEDKQVLPFLTKEDYTLVGFYCSEGENAGRFYYGQITSVPNTAEMRLDAIWKKNVVVSEFEKGTDGKIAITLVNGDTVSVIYADYGSEVELPNVEENGLIFYGWQYAKGQTFGTIYTNGKISSVPEAESMVLYAIFKSSIQSQSNTTIGGVSNTVGGTGLNGGGVISIDSPAGITLSVIGGCAFVGLLLWAIVLLCKKKLQLNLQKSINAYDATVDYKTEAKCHALCRKANRFVLGSSRRGWWRFGMPIICLALVFVFCAQFFNDSFAPAIHTIQNRNQIQQQYVNATAGNPSSDLKHALVNNNSQTISSELAEEGLNEDQSFLLAVVMCDYVSFGYEVFPATVTIGNESIEGIAYSKKSDLYTADNGKAYYSSGFVALPSCDEEIYIDWEFEDVIITPMSKEDIDSKYGYIYSIEESYSSHYISNNRYVVYSVEYSVIDYWFYDNITDNYDLTLGKIYNYDLDRVVYDPELGYNSPKISAQGLNTLTDYELAKSNFRSYIETQNENGLQVNTMSTAYISYAALNEWKLNNQDESFLGISAEEIYQFEAGLSITEYYIVSYDPETGENSLEKVEFPLPPEPTSFWEALWDVVNEWYGKIASIGLIIGGIIVTCVAGPVVGGAMLGAGIELFNQCILEGKKLTEVNWLKVAVATAAGAIAGSGIGIGAAALIGGGLFALESVIEHADSLDSLDSWIEIGYDFLDGFQRSLAIGSVVANPVFCFVAGTGIATINGIKKIEDIRQGDLVASWNETTRQVEYKQVKQLFLNQSKELTHVTTSDGEEIVSTPTHPYYVVNKNYYVDAKNLRAGDILQTVNGKRVVVEQVQHEILEAPVKVYNFEVEDNHNYFVGNSANSGCGGFVLTHNICGTATAGQAVSGAGTVIDWGSIGTSIANGLGKLGQLGVAVGEISASIYFSNALAQTKAEARELTKKDDQKREVHHIVAQHALLATGSKAILNAAGLNVNIPENLVILNYEQHKHLHTNRYHARVFMDMLNACKRALNNLDINKDIKKLLDLINENVEPAAYRTIINVIKKEEYFKDYIDLLKKSYMEVLQREIIRTLNAIAIALLDGTYMIKGIII